MSKRLSETEEHYAVISIPTSFRALWDLHPDLKAEGDRATCLLGKGEYLVKGIVDSHLLIEDDEGARWYVSQATVANPHKEQVELFSRLDRVR